MGTFSDSFMSGLGSGVVGLATDIVGFGLNEWSKSKDRNFTREMYQRQLQDQRENWRMMNEYNKPSAQMERLSEAGLNPNLVYGSGGVTGTTSLPEKSTFNGGYSQPYKSAALENYLQLRNFDKNMKLADQQIDTSRADAESKRALAAYYRSQTTGQDLANWLADNTKDYKLWQEHYKAWNSQFDSELKAEFAFKQAEQTLYKVIAEVALLGEQKKLTAKQRELIYYDEQVRMATVNELVARTGVDYAAAMNYYDTIVSRAIHDDIDATRLQIAPFGTGEMGMIGNASTNIRRAISGNSRVSQIIDNAYERLQNKINNRSTVRSSGMPVANRRFRRKRVK